MTKPEILRSLMALAAHPHREGRGASPWTAADLLDQDQLYAIQGQLLDLMLKLAKTCGASYVDTLVKAFPWAYTTTEGPKP